MGSQLFPNKSLTDLIVLLNHRGKLKNEQGFDSCEQVSERNKTPACFSSLSLVHFKDSSKAFQFSIRLKDPRIRTALKRNIYYIYILLLRLASIKDSKRTVYA